MSGSPSSSAAKTAGVSDDESKALMRRIQLDHLGDLAAIAYRGTGVFNWFERLINDLATFAKWFVVTWFAALTNLPNFILDPLGGGSVLLFAAGSTVILSVMLVVSAIWRLHPVQVVYRRIKAKNGGIGLGNMFYPQIFDSLNDRIREAAFNVMKRPLDTFSQPSNSNVRTFDLELAKMLFCCASLVYERDESTFEDAMKMVARALPSRKRAAAEGTLKTSTGMLTSAGQAVLDKLLDADSFIKKTALKWGLHYESISELSTNTSPVCGAFWDPNSNFIILSFKGTNPVEFSEWVQDFSLNYTKGGAWLPGFGKVHSGFFNNIFPTDLREGPVFGPITQLLHDLYLTLFGGHALDDKRWAPRDFPYEQIRSRLQGIAEQIVRNSPDNRVNLYVTGHSLGAALASMFYARAISSPKDFGKNSDGEDLIRVRDAYTYGCPIFGDATCISAFGRAVHDQLDRPVNLWRVTNRHDPVATMLPELGDYEALSYISPDSQMHFAHLGQEIQMRHFNNLVGCGPGTLLPKGTPVQIITHLGGNGAGPDAKLPLFARILENTPIIARLISHVASFYWVRLCQVEVDDSVPYLGREPALVSL